MGPDRSVAQAVGTPAAVAAVRISKRFGGVQALDEASIAVRPGEIHGLLGENGSGKSTLVNVLAGYHAPEPGGELEVGGRAVELPLRPGQSRRLGMSFVHQDLGLIPSLSVVENLRLVELARASHPFISWSREHRRARSTFELLGIKLDPAAIVADLPLADRAQLAIARAVDELTTPETNMVGGVLVLDEPTAYLPRTERHRLFALVREIAATGAGVLLVSHDLDEALAITDRLTVLRDGRNAGTLDTAAADSRRLIELIVGFASGTGEPPPPPPSVSAPVLLGAAVDGLSGAVVRDLSLEIGEGEVVGLTGLAGSGFEEVPYLLYGAVACRSGHLTLGQRGRCDLRAMAPDQALAAGIALFPGDRARDGGVASLSVGANLTLPVLGRYASGHRLDRARMRRDAAALLARQDVRPADPEVALGTLSGGNQQKAILAKWIDVAPRLLLLDEPTRGVDVGARTRIASALGALARDRVAILCASSDHEELSRLCHRVLVFADGAVAAQLAGDQLTALRIAERCQTSGRAAPGASG